MRFSISPKGLFCKATAILTAAFFISSGIFIPTSFALPMMFTRNETRQFVPVVTLDQANLRKKTADKQDFVPSGVAVQSDSPLLPLRSNLDQTENSVPQTQAPLEEKRIPQRSPAPPPDQIQVLSYGDRYTSTNITQPFASVASPDGKNVYVATSTGIAWFNRDSVSGSLTYVNQISGISGRFIAIAPDGSSVYASTNQNHIVAAFSRDAATGALTQVGQYSDSSIINSPDGLTVSPDGKNVYVTAYNSNAVAWFSRDLTTGVLTYMDRFSSGDIGGPWSVVISSDGKHAYVASELSNSVAWFTRNTTTGALTYGGKYSDVSNASAPLSLDISADGRNVYVASRDTSSVCWFNRNTTTGALTYAGKYSNSAVLYADAYVAVSPDGNYVFVASTATATVAWFGRDAATGALTYAGQYTSTTNIQTPRTLTVSPDSRNVYVPGWSVNALAWFKMDTDATAEITFASIPAKILQGTDLTVTATTNPVHVDSYQWFLDGAEIPGAITNTLTTGRQLVPGNHTLAMKVMIGQTASTKSFDFSVTNVIGITFAGIPTKLIAGTGLTATAATDPALTDYAYQWYVDGIAIQGATSSTVTTGSQLTVGSHRLSLTVTRGVVTATQNADFTVTNSIGILFAGAQEQIFSGHNMVVTATTDPSPVSAYQWYLDGVAIQNATAASITLGSNLAARTQPYVLSLEVRAGIVTNTSSLNFTVLDSTAGVPILTYEGAWTPGDYYMGGAGSIALSPNGNNAYVAASAYLRGITWLSRDASTGALSGNITANRVPPLLTSPNFVTVSPDGGFVYITGAGGTFQGVAWFKRNTTTGALTAGSVSANTNAYPGNSNVVGAMGITFSPDGKFAYVSASTSGAVAWFSRNATTGALTYIDRYASADIAGARSVVISPDGKHVYVVGASSNSVAWFTRDNATGALVYGGSYANSGIAAAQSVTVTADGNFVYVAASGSNTVAWFRRDNVTGALTYINKFSSSDIAGAYAVATSPNGTYAYVTSLSTDAVAWFVRNGTTGELIYKGKYQSSNIDNPTSVLVSPDSKHIYVTGSFVPSAAWFDMNAAVSDIPISFSGVPEKMTVGTGMTVVASTTNPAVMDAYQWYLDGALLPGQTTDTITLGSQVPAGKHQLKLEVVFNGFHDSFTKDFIIFDPNISFSIGTQNIPSETAQYNRAYTDVTANGFHQTVALNPSYSSSGSLDFGRVVASGVYQDHEALTEVNLAAWKQLGMDTSRVLKAELVFTANAATATSYSFSVNSMTALEDGVFTDPAADFGVATSTVQTFSNLALTTAPTPITVDVTSALLADLQGSGNFSGFLVKPRPQVWTSASNSSYISDYAIEPLVTISNPILRIYYEPDPVPPTQPVVTSSIPQVTSQTKVLLSGTKEANTSIWINGTEVVALNSATVWAATISLSLEGNNPFSITARKASGLTSLPRTLSVLRDTIAPTGSITINGGADYATSPAVTLNLTGQDAGSGIDQMRFSTDGGANWSSWATFSNTRAITLSAGSGMKQVQCQFQDKAGLISDVLSDSIFETSLPRILEVPSPLNGMKMRFTAEAGVNYEIQATTDLVHWTTRIILKGSTGEISWTDPVAPGGMRFYRIMLTDSPGWTQVASNTNYFLRTQENGSFKQLLVLDQKSGKTTQVAELPAGGEYPRFQDLVDVSPDGSIVIYGTAQSAAESTVFVQSLSDASKKLSSSGILQSLAFVSGSKNVQLHFQDGKTLLVGSPASPAEAPQLLEEHKPNGVTSYFSVVDGALERVAIQPAGSTDPVPTVEIVRPVFTEAPGPVNQWTLKFDQAMKGVRYEIQYSTMLMPGSWQVADSFVADHYGAMSWQDPLGKRGNSVFFRVVAKEMTTAADLLTQINLLYFDPAFGQVDPTHEYPVEGWVNRSITQPTNFGFYAYLLATIAAGDLVTSRISKAEALRRLNVLMDSLLKDQAELGFKGLLPWFQSTGSDWARMNDVYGRQVSFEDNTNLSNSLAVAYGALLDETLQGNTAIYGSGGILAKINSFIDNQKVGYLALYDSKNNIFHRTMQILDGSFSGGTVDYFGAESRAPLLFLILQYGDTFPASAYAKQNFATRSYTMQDGSTEQVVAPLNGAFQMYWPALLMPESQNQDLRRMLETYTDVQLDYANRNDQPGLLSASYDIQAHDLLRGQVWPFSWAGDSMKAVWESNRFHITSPTDNGIGVVFTETGLNASGLKLQFRYSSTTAVPNARLEFKKLVNGIEKVISIPLNLVNTGGLPQTVSLTLPVDANLNDLKEIVFATSGSSVPLDMSLYNLLVMDGSYKVAYNSYLGIGEIAYDQTSSVETTPSVYNLGIASMFRPAGVEALLQGMIADHPELITNHGLWEGTNMLYDKTVTEQIFGNISTFILGMTGTGPSYMTRYLENKGLAAKLESIWNPQTPVSVTGGQTTVTNFSYSDGTTAYKATSWKLSENVRASDREIRITYQSQTPITGVRLELKHSTSQLPTYVATFDLPATGGVPGEFILSVPADILYWAISEMVVLFPAAKGFPSATLSRIIIAPAGVASPAAVPALNPAQQFNAALRPLAGTPSYPVVREIQKIASKSSLEQQLKLIAVALNDSFNKLMLKKISKTEVQAFRANWGQVQKDLNVALQADKKADNYNSSVFAFEKMAILFRDICVKLLV